MNSRIFVTVKVSDRQPEVEGNYIVSNGLGFFEAYWNNGFGFHGEFMDCSGVTEWLELQTFPSDGELYVFTLQHAIRHLTDEQRLALGRELLDQQGAIPTEQAIWIAGINHQNESDGSLTSFMSGAKYILKLLKR